ncbi:hypothetical protein [Streptomyces sp. NPDC059015]|uniref:hypothetical protein n=1 Tax=unclassified Streptomyces TaxID=2593676 RepID=UPI003684B2C3
MNKHLRAVLALVDTAERRPLTAEEADRLRTVLAGYDQARRQLGAILTARSTDERGAA